MIRWREHSKGPPPTGARVRDTVAAATAHSASLQFVPEPLDSSDDEHGTAAVLMQQDQIKQRR
eukprot:7388263-Prymnesium_polylepis.1